MHLPHRCMTEEPNDGKSKGVFLISNDLCIQILVRILNGMLRIDYCLI